MGGGRCAVFLVAALVLDAAGLALVLAGAVGQPWLGGCPFEDFLVLTGALLLFLSLLCWLFWYSGNLGGVPAEELPVGALPAAGPPAPRRRASLARLAAKLSERLSRRRSFAPAAAASCWPPPSRSAAAAAAAAALSLRSWAPLELSPLAQQAMPGERLV